jgi:hypothetical protein
MADDGIEFTGHIVHQTDAAVLFHVDDAGEEIWFPLSVCEVDDNSIVVPRWLARARDLL